MPTFTLRIDCNDDAFAQDMPGEVARILRTAAADIGHHALFIGDSERLKDSNGNTVGLWKVTDGED